MYKEIDELVEAICQDHVFKEYQNAERLLQDKKMLLLLSRHQTLQDDYLKMKQFKNYVSDTNLKEQLKSLKQEMAQEPVIQNYYQSYYAINELLDEVTTWIFQGISDEVIANRFGLRG